MDLLTRFTTHWEKLLPGFHAGNTHLLVAVSGGVDSVVLTDLAHRAGFRITIAHCNFQLRGQESERDEQFVTALAEKYAADLLVRKFDTAGLASERKASIQETARELRYTWFAGIMENDPGKNYLLLTAHHADDNIETVLMHLFRGTGISGLSGIPAFDKDRRIARPLLPFRKDELLRYANAEGLSFVEDSSNESIKYTRNFFRNSMLPQIREVFPLAEENILHTIERVSEAASVYHASVAETLSKTVEKKGSEFLVPVLKWKKLSPLQTLTWEIIRPFGFQSAQVGGVIRLLDAANGAFMLSDTHRIFRNRNWMIIAPLNTQAAGHIQVTAGEEEVLFPSGQLLFKNVAVGFIDPSPDIALVDAAALEYPLLLRPWKTGDYFYPLGMQKKKKLNRFFIDQKLSRTEKERVWVIESNKKIVWVIGLRIDNRFRIRETTKELLKITFLPAH